MDDIRSCTRDVRSSSLPFPTQNPKWKLGVLVSRRGFFAANPAKMAASEAEQVFGANATITLVSLGTGLKSLVGQWKDLKDTRKVMDEQADSVMNQIAEQTRKHDGNKFFLIKGVKRTHTNIQNSPDLVRRIATQLLEVATDTEMTHM
jgi:hypothetical protein